MNDEQVFALANAAALLGWVVLVLAPRRWRWLNALPAVALPLGLSGLYAALVMVHLGPAEGGFGTLADVRLLMSHDAMLLAGWVHYLAFDLLVGALMAAAFDRAGLARLLQAPLLITVFLLGPLGYLLSSLTLLILPHLKGAADDRPA